MSDIVIESDIEGQVSFDLDASAGADGFKNIDERINCKIAAGMKKAIHLIVNRFDTLFQQKLKILAHAEVDARIKEMREVLAAEEALQSAGKSPAISCSPDKMKVPSN